MNLKISNNNHDVFEVIQISNFSPSILVDSRDGDSTFFVAFDDSVFIRLLRLLILGALSVKISFCLILGSGSV